MFTCARCLMCDPRLLVHACVWVSIRHDGNYAIPFMALKKKQQQNSNVILVICIFNALSCKKKEKKKNDVQCWSQKRMMNMIHGLTK